MIFQQNTHFYKHFCENSIAIIILPPPNQILLEMVQIPINNILATLSINDYDNSEIHVQLNHVHIRHAYKYVCNEVSLSVFIYFRLVLI